MRRSRRGRRRGVEWALMGGAGAAAAHLLRAAQVLGVVSAGTAHGARPARSGAVLPLPLPPFLFCPQPTPKAASKQAGGQAGLRRGALSGSPVVAPGSRRTGRAPRAASTLINRMERAGLRSQSALARLPLPLPPLAPLPSSCPPSLPHSLTRRPPPHLGPQKRLRMAPGVTDSSCPSSAALLEIQKMVPGKM